MLLLFAALLQVAFGELSSFQTFLLRHNKSYGTTELQRRQQIFNQTAAKVEEHNRKFAAGLVSYSMAINQFADLSEEEIVDRFKTLPINASRGTDLKNLWSNSSSIPDSLDWRESGIVTEVKDQGSCGGCWAFSATGALEGQLALTYGNLTSLSEQQLLDCDTKVNQGCDGGYVDVAFEYARLHGLTLEDMYPYQAKQGSCKKHLKNYARAGGFAVIAEGDEDGLKQAVALIGPVSVAIDATPIVRYSTGIFSDTCSKVVNHGLLAVGYGEEAGQPYWILKNSWGPSWGENGYLRLAMGQGLCGIAQQACYPVGVTNEATPTMRPLLALVLWTCLLIFVGH